MNEILSVDLEHVGRYQGRQLYRILVNGEAQGNLVTIENLPGFSKTDQPAHRPDLLNDDVKAGE